MLRSWALFSFLCLFSLAGEASLFKSEAKQALLIDLTTGTILYEKEADRLVSPSSMSKIMTVYLVFNEIKQGRLSLEDTFTVSKKAWKMRGSRMFIRVKSDITVSDLLRGVIVQSGNDAAIALAEGVAGSEEAFVEMMNRKAQEIGARDAHFTNATGWPDSGHQMTLRDLAVIATRTMMDFPDYYALYKEPSFTYNNIKQPNRNPLLFEKVGCDGLKTGHTDLGGYGLVASTLQKGRRLLMIINGCKTKKQRAQASKRLITYGYRAFASTILYSAGQTVEEADVWMGVKNKISLVSETDIAITVPRSLIKDIVIEVVYKTPLQAPISVGDPVAKVVVKIPGKPDKEYPLIAGETSKKVGFFSRIGSAFSYLVFGGA